ncbi:MAG: uroporphyrinogen decarboxylase family protein [Thermofilaceae archaeon]
MELLASPRENLLAALRHEEPEWLPCPMFDGSLVVVSHGLVEHCLEGMDSWGVVWVLRDERSGSFPKFHPLRDPEAIDDYPFPSPERADLREALRIAREVDRRVVLLAGDNGWGLFERAWLLVGMERLFVWSYRYPDAVKRLIERIAEVKVGLTRRLAEEAGVEMVLYGDDWGMNDRLLFPVRWWREFIKPWQAKLYKVAKQYGLIVYQHSDGRVEDLLPDLAEMGVDVVNIQPECNNWPKVKRVFARRLALWGGVSARTLDLGTPADVDREVKAVAELGREGGVVLAPGHSMKFPPENLNAMKQAWLKYGRYKR